MGEFKPLQRMIIPMTQVKEITCKSCKEHVEPSIFKDFYECKKCQSITNNVNIIAVDTIGNLRISCV